MVLLSHRAGALPNSQSPIEADGRGGDGTSMLSRVPGLLVNTAHFRGYSGLQAEDEVSAFPGRSTDLPTAAQRVA